MCKIDGIQRNKYFHILAEEFEAFLTQLQGVFADSILGHALVLMEIKRNINFLKQLFENNKELCSDEFQDSAHFSHEYLSMNFIPGSGMFYHKKGDVRERNKDGGKNCVFMGKMVIIMLYEYWEKYFRKKVAVGYGLEKSNDYKDDFWSDLCLIRNSILHCGGKASKKLEKKAKIFKGFFEGKEIIITKIFISRILQNAYEFKNKLYAESFQRENRKEMKINSYISY